MVRFTTTFTPMTAAGASVDSSSRTTLWALTTFTLNAASVSKLVPFTRVPPMVTGYVPRAVPSATVSVTVAMSASPVRALSELTILENSPDSLFTENRPAQASVAFTPLRVMPVGRVITKRFDVMASAPVICKATLTLSPARASTSPATETVWAEEPALKARKVSILKKIFFIVYLNLFA